MDDLALSHLFANMEQALNELETAYKDLPTREYEDVTPYEKIDEQLLILKGLIYNGLHR